MAKVTWRRVSKNEDIETGTWPVIDGTLYAGCSCCTPGHIMTWPIDGKLTRKPIKTIYGGVRSDGYPFLMQFSQKDVYSVRAGCRHFTSLADARNHWKGTRGGTILGNETMKILEKMERAARKARLLSKAAR